MTISRATLKKIIAEELSRGNRRSRLPSLASVLFEDAEAIIKRNPKEAEKVDMLLQQMPDLKDGPGAMKAFLNGPGSDPKVRAFLSAGEIDGAKVDEKIPYVDTGKRVGDLQPTQSEIEFMNSVSYPLTAPGAITNTRTGGIQKIGPPGNDHIITCGNIIIDGHHRWSSFMSTAGPDGQIAAYDLQITGKSAPELLAIAQIAIAATKPTPVPDASAGQLNILDKSKEEIKNMIIDNIGKPNEKGKEILSKAVVEGIAVDDKLVKDAKLDAGAVNKFLESEGKDAASKQKICEGIAEFMAGNLEQMNVPAKGAPPRLDMPQLDQAAGGVNTVLDMLDAGVVNFKPSYVDPAAVKKESVNNRDRLIMERWNKLAGIK